MRTQGISIPKMIRLGTHHPRLVSLYNNMRGQPQSIYGRQEAVDRP